MTEHSTFLLEHFPIRKSKEQKAAFRQWLIHTLHQAGYQPGTEEHRGPVSSTNVVVGDPERAEIILTAHYDTCAVLPLPNLITPRNPVTFLLYQVALGVLMVLPAIAAEVLVIRLFHAPLWAAMVTLYGVLFFLLWWMLAGKANRHNVNDNTSGVITLLETALALPEEDRNRVAFVFFDNEEKGLLGSAAFYKKHRAGVGDTLVLNFDCVSDGDHILFIPSKKLKKNGSAMDRLERAFPPAGDKHTLVCRTGFSVYPSDQKHFSGGVGVAACHKAPWVGYWLGRIHTGRDTVLMEDNIHLLRRGVLALLRQKNNQPPPPV